MRANGNYLAQKAAAAAANPAARLPAVSRWPAQLRRDCTLLVRCPCPAQDLAANATALAEELRRGSGYIMLEASLVLYTEP